MPGPRTPRDAGICLELIAKAAPTVPVLGVRLGNRAIGEAFGGAVVQVHGKLSKIRHQGEGIYIRSIYLILGASKYSGVAPRYTRYSSPRLWATKLILL